PPGAPAPLPDPAPTQIPGRAATSAASNILGLLDVDVFEKVTAGLNGADLALGFADHMFNDPAVTETSVGRVIVAAEHAAVDTFGASSPTSVVANIAASALEGVPVVGDVAAVAAGIVPENAAAAGVHAAIDSVATVGAALTGSPGAGFRAAESLDAAALRGHYGAPSQALAMVGAIALDDRRAIDALTSPEAEGGAFGPLVALGNNIGDAVFDWVNP
ncbi:MAG: hypothetical protein H6697_05700, partial [Myxococcales bacterium]|nr:hypothetical protein [Myxococcales bacterium]